MQWSTKYTRYLKADPEVEKWENPLQSAASTSGKDEAVVLTLTYFWPAKKQKMVRQKQKRHSDEWEITVKRSTLSDSRVLRFEEGPDVGEYSSYTYPYPCPDCHRSNKWNNTAKGNWRRYLKAQPKAFTLILSNKPKSHRPGPEIIQTFLTHLKRQERPSALNSFSLKQDFPSIPCIPLFYSI